MKKQWRLTASAACLAAVSALVLGGVPSNDKCVGAYDMRKVRVEFCFGAYCSGHPARTYRYEANCLTWCCPDGWQLGRVAELSVCDYIPSTTCCPESGPKPSEGCQSPPSVSGR